MAINIGGFFLFLIKLKLSVEPGYILFAKPFVSLRVHNTTFFSFLSFLKRKSVNSRQITMYPES